ncbi:MAG: hypothetical protein AAGA43_15535 [Bacteroidota bacterium]
MQKHKLFWKGNNIGVFEEHSMDMGYLDGKFEPDNSDLAREFIEKSSNLDMRSVMINPVSGFRALLETKDSYKMNVLVLGISSEYDISLKWINGKQETIDWFITNVPEE